MVVPIFSPGQAPDTQASPTSGSGPGRVSTSGSQSESKPAPAIPCANATMASGPRLSPPALMPMRIFTARPPVRRWPASTPASSTSWCVTKRTVPGAMAWASTP